MAGPPQQVIDACHQQVLEQLPTPATAKFEADAPVAWKQGTRGGIPAYSVAGTVDAQNLAGADVRQIWACGATLNGQGTYTATVPLLTPGSSVPPGFLDQFHS